MIKRPRQFHWPCQGNIDMWPERVSTTADQDSRVQVPPLYNTKSGRRHRRHTCSTCAGLLEFYVTNSDAMWPEKEERINGRQQRRTMDGRKGCNKTDMGKTGTEEHARSSCKQGGMEEITNRESSGKWTGRRENPSTRERGQEERGRR